MWICPRSCGTSSRVCCEAADKCFLRGVACQAAPRPIFSNTCKGKELSMHKPKIQQKTERRISAACVWRSWRCCCWRRLRWSCCSAWSCASAWPWRIRCSSWLAIAVAVRIYMKPGRTTSYKLGWILLVLAVPVAGLILYFLWNGDRQQKRLDLKKKPSLDENEAVRGAARRRSRSSAAAVPSGASSPTISACRIFCSTSTRA